MRTLTKILAIGLFLSAFSLFGAEKESDFQINFNIAKRHLSRKEVMKALPYLKYLQDHHPNSDNLKYLIGVCYVEAEITDADAILLLEQASLNISTEYDPNILEEKRAPVYALYYLSVAYSQSKRCEQAKKARKKFIEVYHYDDQFYIEESLTHIKKCEGNNDEPVKKALPEFKDFKPFVSKDKLLVDSVPSSIKASETPKVIVKKEENIVTRKKEYSAHTPIYGVQLGAFHEVIPVSRFKKLKNVDAFVDREGLIRYVIGKFSIHSQAMSLLEIVKEKGYKDAFVVNINGNRKFTDEVVSVNNMNIRAKISYSIQIGAFKERIPLRTAKVYFQIEGIRELHDDNYTYLTVGEFENYTEAKAYEKNVRGMGIADAFVIAVANGLKVPLEKTDEF